MPFDAEIRPATGGDLGAMERIVDDAYRHYIERIGRKPGPMLDDYAALIAEGLVRVLVSADEVAGLLVLIPQADAMLLDNVAIAPGAQGRGFGRLLMDHADAAARAASLDLVRLYTNEAMVENIALYQRLGFHETGRVVEKGLRRVYMEKRLG